MKYKKRQCIRLGGAAFYILAYAVFPAFAQDILGPADASRIQSLGRPVIPDRPPAKFVVPEGQSSGVTIPDSAKQVKFTLSQIRLEGASIFTENELGAIYQPYLNHEITLDIIWRIAGQITERYQNAGYFLSRAYVPAQEIDGGVVTIKVVEGYIGEVNVEDSTLADHFFVRQLTARIKDKRPLSAYDLESFMLQTNALPGFEFRAFVEPLKGVEDGVTRLSLHPQKETGNGLVSFDNFGSRFLGPHQATLTYQDSFLPLQETTLSGLTSIPTDEIKYFSLLHVVPVYPDWTVELSGSYSTSAPGASLRSNDIKGNSRDIGLNVNWKPIRQRQENLTVSLELTGKNTNSDILSNNPLTRDRIRVARGRLGYDTSDSWNGYNYITFIASRGLNVLGASEDGDANLSRAGAESDFSTAQFSYIRQQAISNNLTLIGQFSGQLASGSLFSSEEFGYGGQTFGRAYDPSELTGDHGLAASLELRYLGIGAWQEASFVPYAFYDIGKVWNEDIGGIAESAAAAGLGVRVNHSSGFTGNLGLAYPLTHDISVPIYGNSINPRVLFHLGYGF